MGSRELMKDDLPVDLRWHCACFEASRAMAPGVIVLHPGVRTVDVDGFDGDRVPDAVRINTLGQFSPLSASVVLQVGGGVSEWIVDVEPAHACVSASVGRRLIRVVDD